jgi:hypothetical protein
MEHGPSSFPLTRLLDVLFCISYSVIRCGGTFLADCIFSTQGVCVTHAICCLRGMFLKMGGLLIVLWTILSTCATAYSAVIVEVRRSTIVAL